MTGPAIDDGYAQAAAEDRADAQAVQYEQAQAEADEETRYLPTLAEPHPERYSYEAAVNGEYPALCDDPDCKPCEASEAAWRQEEAALDAAWRREELERAAAAEAEANEPEAGA